MTPVVALVCRLGSPAVMISKTHIAACDGFFRCLFKLIAVSDTAVFACAVIHPPVGMFAVYICMVS